MAKIKYKAAEQTIAGRHVVYAVPQTAGTLTFDELCEEACEDNTYSPAECLAFVQDVMTLTRDRATVYWKQSFREFIGGTPAHRLFKDDELRRIFDDYPNAVDARWNMFNDK